MHPYTMEIVTHDKLRKFHDEADERRTAKSFRLGQRPDAARRFGWTPAVMGAAAAGLTLLLLLL